MIRYLLLEDISCGRTCLSGVHVFQDDMSNGSIYLSYLRVCLIGGHVLQADMSYMSTCFTGWQI